MSQLRSGIGAINAIEAIMLSAARSALFLPWSMGDEVGPAPYEVQHAYAVSIGCDAVCGQWHYDFAEHEFITVIGPCSTPPPPMPAERMGAVIACAERIYERYEAYVASARAHADDIDAKPKRMRATCG